MKKYLLALVAILLIMGCAPAVKVFYDWDHDVDFKTFKSYRWGEIDPKHNALAENHIMLKRVYGMVDSVLQSRGYVKVKDSTESVDFVVVSYATIKESYEVQQDSPSYSVGVSGYSHGYYGYGSGFYGGGWYSPWWGPSVSVGYSSAPSYSIEKVRDGSLIIDIVDDSSKELSWRGTGTIQLDDFEGAEDAILTLQQIITSVLANFPPELAKPVALDQRAKLRREEKAAQKGKEASTVVDSTKSTDVESKSRTIKVESTTVDSSATQESSDTTEEESKEVEVE